MIETLDLEKLADLVAKKIVENTLNMNERALWSPKDVGQYLKRSASFAYHNVLDEPDFPARVKIDDKPRNPVWRAGDVMAWVDRRNGMGRPRKAV